VLGRRAHRGTGARPCCRLLKCRCCPPSASVHLTRVLPSLASALPLVCAAAAGQLKPLLQALQANPADHESRLQLSERLAASGQPEQAVEHLLHIIRAAPAWNGGAAKAMLLKLFDSLGSGHPVAVSGRKQLSKLLFR